MIKSPIVAPNTHAASTGSCCGQVGNSENPFRKYSGRMKWACNEINSPRIRKMSHIGGVM